MSEEKCFYFRSHLKDDFSPAMKPDPDETAAMRKSCHFSADNYCMVKIKKGRWGKLHYSNQ
jgi:hypothetical protein